MTAFQASILRANARCHRLDPSLQLLPAYRVVFLATLSWLHERRKRSTISRNTLRRSARSLFADWGVLASSRDALSRILEAFIAKELQPWIKTFPA